MSYLQILQLPCDSMIPILKMVSCSHVQFYVELFTNSIRKPLLWNYSFLMHVDQRMTPISTTNIYLFLQQIYFFCLQTVDVYITYLIYLRKHASTSSEESIGQTKPSLLQYLLPRRKIYFYYQRWNQSKILPDFHPMGAVAEMKKLR